MKANHSPAIVVFPSKMSCLNFASLILSLTLSLTVPLILGATAHAQIDRAELEGTVTDSSGAAIAGASVKIAVAATGLEYEQRTTSNGYYHFFGLAVGRYRVTVVNKGFRAKVIDNVILQVGQTRTLDVGLVVGGWQKS